MKPHGQYTYEALSRLLAYFQRLLVNGLGEEIARLLVVDLDHGEGDLIFDAISVVRRLLLLYLLEQLLAKLGHETSVSSIADDAVRFAYSIIRINSRVCLQNLPYIYA